MSLHIMNSTTIRQIIVRYLENKINQKDLAPCVPQYHLLVSSCLSLLLFTSHEHGCHQQIIFESDRHHYHALQ